MAEYRIRIWRTASQDLARLDKPIGRRIVQRIHWLATNLDAIHLEILTGDLAGLTSFALATIESFMKSFGVKRRLWFMQSAIGKRFIEDGEGVQDTMPPNIHCCG